MPQVTTKENMLFVGVDVAKHKLDICYNDNQKESFPNTNKGFELLKKKLPAPGSCLIVLEPTGGYEKELITSLHKANHNVILANALKVRRYAEAI